MKCLSPKLGIALTIIALLMIISIPFPQTVNSIRTFEDAIVDEDQYRVIFGGPRIVLVSVFCNDSAEIRFMYQEGVWIDTHDVLLASYQSKSATYNYNAEHSTTIIEILSEGPIQIRIVYIYSVEQRMGLFERVLYDINLNRQFLLLTM